jgi:hypothetical protein
VIAASLDESVPGAPAAVLKGRFVSLFEDGLPLREEVRLEPGRRAFLFDLGTVPAGAARIVAAACRVSDEKATAETLTFRAEGIASTEAVVRIVLPKAPQVVRVKEQDLPPDAWAFEGGTLVLRFSNSPDGVSVEVRR